MLERRRSFIVSVENFGMSYTNSVQYKLIKKRFVHFCLTAVALAITCMLLASHISPTSYVHMSVVLTQPRPIMTSDVSRPNLSTVPMRENTGISAWTGPKVMDISTATSVPIVRPYRNTRFPDDCVKFAKDNSEKIVKDANLLKLHRLCFPNGTSNGSNSTTSDIHATSSGNSASTVDPGMFDRLFTVDIFGDVGCDDRQTRFNLYGPIMPKVALASFPGSGNTWARILLEQLTGIYTGSVYFDLHINHTQKGSNYCPWDGSVYIIKTHSMGDTYNKSTYCGHRHLHFKKAIYILRNPYDAVLAEYNRETAGKIRSVNKTMFETQNWVKLATDLAGTWADHVKYWLHDFHRPVYVLVYENLKKNTLFELYKISKFLGYPIRLKTLWCISARPDEQSDYQRIKPSWLSKETIYSKELVELFDGHLRLLMDTFKNKRQNVVRHLKQYLLSVPSIRH